MVAGSVLLPHLACGWHVNRACLSEDRLLIYMSNCKCSSLYSSRADLAPHDSGGVGMRFPLLPRLFAVARCVIAGTCCPIRFENGRQLDW
jgi:hypothetical protein